jgi:hypothetical protein
VATCKTFVVHFVYQLFFQITAHLVFIAIIDIIWALLTCIEVVHDILYICEVNDVFDYFTLILPYTKAASTACVVAVTHVIVLALLEMTGNAVFSFCAQYKRVSTYMNYLNY